jgi:tRNA G18 (ribose-2'-O)-methylase SpoU
LISLADQKVVIPMKGIISSLNVSVVAGILIYEILRQRNK